FLPADLEIAQAALRLRAPITAVVNFDGPERVRFGAGLGHGNLVLGKVISCGRNPGSPLRPAFRWRVWAWAPPARAFRPRAQARALPRGRERSSAPRPRRGTEARTAR